MVNVGEQLFVPDTVNFPDNFAMLHKTINMSKYQHLNTANFLFRSKDTV